MIEVAKFVGCLSEVGIEFVKGVLELRMKSFCVQVMAYMVLLGFAGCVQMDLSSAADCDENSKMQFRDVTSAYWWDWGESAQNLLDDRLQGANGRVDERAIQRLIVSQEWWEVLMTWGSLGIVKPVELTIWLEEEK